MKKNTGIIVSIIILFIICFALLGFDYMVYKEHYKMNDTIDNIKKELSKKVSSSTIDDNKNTIKYGTDENTVSKTIYKDGTAVNLSLNYYVSKLGYKMLYNKDTFSVISSSEEDTYTYKEGNITLKVTKENKSLDKLTEENKTYNPTKTSYGYIINFPATFDKEHRLIHYYIKNTELSTFKIVASYPIKDFGKHYEKLDSEITLYMNSLEQLKLS